MTIEGIIEVTGKISEEILPEVGTTVVIFTVDTVIGNLEVITEAIEATLITNEEEEVTITTTVRDKCTSWKANLNHRMA